MAVQECLFWQRSQRKIEFAILLLAGEEFLQQQRLPRQRLRRIALEQGRQLVAEGEQAARLQTDDGNAARGVWREHGQRALHFAPRLVDLADRQEGAAAAER